VARRNSLGRKKQPQTVGFVVADEAPSTIQIAQVQHLSEQHGLRTNFAKLVALHLYGETPDVR
jgi:hypothetical protein